jgi:RimJ/RimL family protein N-acetyltransferase
MITSIILTKTVIDDLDQLFLFQLDKETNFLSAFTANDNNDKAAYLKKHTPFLSDPSIHMQTIWLGDKIVGSIAKFVMEGNPEITYWIDRKYWGQGIATAALKKFLNLEGTRPIHARVAYDNIGSQRVIEKCGFVKIGTDRGFANARQAEIEEYLYKLS